MGDDGTEEDRDPFWTGDFGLEFDGSEKYVSTLTSPADPSNSLSATSWIRPSNLDPDGSGRMVLASMIDEVGNDPLW